MTAPPAAVMGIVGGRKAPIIAPIMAPIIAPRPRTNNMLIFLVDSHRTVPKL